MADDVTLLPCKVCNSKRAVPVRYESRSYGPYWRVSCANCEYDGPARKTKEEAAAAWNTRVPDPRVAELEAELAKSRAWRATLADTGDELLAELRDARRRIAELEAQLADARDCIDLFNGMIVRAECAWKEQHPDSEFYPDVPDLIVWLKEQVDALAARRCETCAHYDGAEHTSICWTHDSHMPPDGFCSYYEPKEDALADALAGYEAEHYPIDPPTPEAAAEFRREQGADGE